ncbi:hypothetical protein [Enterobacter kobei]|uniref:hypothetical protein n=1 Tax=Enterobacter kobei TaxID=208224 RepID=UPI002FD090F7
MMMDDEKPVTYFERLDDLLTELSKYGHSEFWYRETDIGVPGTPGARRLRRILTRDNRDIARWGFNGRRWDFFPAHSTPNKDLCCSPPANAERIDSTLASEVQWHADMDDVYKS